MSPWIMWALSVERLATTRTLIDTDRAAQVAKRARSEMLAEVERLGLGFCERDEFQRYLEASR